MRLPHAAVAAFEQRMVDTMTMARPSKPLIRRDAVVEASLRIIDTEGLDAFSLPRLARELNVQAPSLYHHFESGGAGNSGRDTLARPQIGAQLD